MKESLVFPEIRTEFQHLRIDYIFVRCTSEMFQYSEGNIAPTITKLRDAEMLCLDVVSGFSGVSAVSALVPAGWVLFPWPRK